MRKAQNKSKGLTKAESWVNERLVKEGLKFSTQSIWRWRIYDFWNHVIGCAIEVDGPEHNIKKDKEKDLSDYNRSGIIVLRIRNFNQDDLDKTIEDIKNMEEWHPRRRRLNIPLTVAEKKKIYAATGNWPKEIKLKPLKIIKSMQTTFDMLQEDLEQTKSETNTTNFQAYLLALECMTRAQDLVKKAQGFVRTTVKE